MYIYYFVKYELACDRQDNSFRKAFLKKLPMAEVVKDLMALCCKTNISDI